jgi:penicillin amidase
LKYFKRIAIFLLALLLLGFLAGVFAYHYLKPDYDGVKQLEGLEAQVEVYFDAYGVPHIYGETEEDAFRALGYVHAQDRLWQMELLRRVARGGLSEVFGRDLLKTDRFFLALGISESSRETVANLDPESPEVRIARAYLDGINSFIKNGPTPIEFYLTGIDKTPFTLEDIHNAIGYMAFSFAMAHKTDPLLSDIREKLGPEYLRDLEIGADTLHTRIRNYRPVARDTALSGLVTSVNTALDKLPLPQFIGSNSWVIAPGKTRGGKVILANDPHIGFAQPAVWFEAHLKTPEYEKYGYHLAGIPFPLLGHNRLLAYGLTMFENDDIDFYYEQTNPEDSTRYQSPKGWESFETVTHSIAIKGENEVSFTYRKTSHGPLMNDLAEQLSPEKPVSMSWIYTKRKNELLHVLYGMSHARDLEAFRSSLPGLHAPGLNVMYGDAKGNVAWWASARLYRMPDSLNTKFILNGGSGAEEPMGDYDFAENPQAINPPWDYVYSANNQPEPVDGRMYPGYYLPENRARRIVEILESKDDWDKKSVSTMILDDTSPVNPGIVTNLAKYIDVNRLTDEQIKILDKLNHWRGNYALRAVEPTVFHRWVYFFLKNTFADELGEEQFKAMMATHFHKRLIAPMAEKDNSVWWDDVNTPDKVETKKDIVQAAFEDAYNALLEQLGDEPDLWTWNRVHTLEHQHPIGNIASLRSFFNVGPFPVRGSREVINNMAFTYREDGKNEVHSGPSTRRIVDFSDIENSLSILPTGQSGNPFSPHYKDQADLYNNGKFRKTLLNRDEIIATSNSLLIFKSQ